MVLMQSNGSILICLLLVPLPHIQGTVHLYVVVGTDPSAYGQAHVIGSAHHDHHALRHLLRDHFYSLLHHLHYLFLALVPVTIDVADVPQPPHIGVKRFLSDLREELLSEERGCLFCASSRIGIHRTEVGRITNKVEAARVTRQSGEMRRDDVK
jgi:hypothetical protein